MDEATQAELTSIRLSGGRGAAASASLARPDGVRPPSTRRCATATSAATSRVRWSAQGARMALIRDRRTGEVLSFARGARRRFVPPAATSR